jgi:hypothetical protein
MGRRAILVVVLLGSLIAAGQMWLLSAMLSRPLPSGKTGWDVMATGIPSPPQQERRPGMPTYIEPVSPPYAIEGCPLIFPGQQVHLPISILQPYSNGYMTEYGLQWDTPPTSPNRTASSYQGPEEPSLEYPFTWIDNFSAPTQPGLHTLYLCEFEEDGVTVLASYQFAVYIDGDSPPSFSGVSREPTNCDPLIWQVSTTVGNQPTSWSYELFDLAGDPVSGGTVNSPPSPTECSAEMVVSNIPGAARSIKLTATNANGSAEVTQSLFLQPASVTLEAEPAWITEGNESVLHWTAEGCNSAEIDNGIGLVWGPGSSGEPEGWITVEPSETTTYTITGTASCRPSLTAQATVNVQGTPRPATAVMEWIGYAPESLKIARLEGPAILQWFAIDPSRTPQHARVNARAAALEDVRTPQHARSNARSTARVFRQVRVNARSTTRNLTGARSVARSASHVPSQLYVVARSLARSRSFYPDRIHIMARDTATGQIAELGVLDAEASPLVLPDVPLAPGTYELWTEREGLFWKNARRPEFSTLTVTDGQPPIQDLPWAVDLAARVSGGLTAITWTAEPPITREDLTWGLWYADNSPVEIDGPPHDRVRATIGQFDYLAVRLQDSAEVVSVAMIDPAGNRGLAVERKLPWSIASPASPANQTAQWHG